MAVPPQLLMAAAQMLKNRKSTKDRIKEALAPATDVLKNDIAPLVYTAAQAGSTYNEMSENPSMRTAITTGGIAGAARGFQSNGITGLITGGIMGGLTGAIATGNAKEQKAEQDKYTYLNQMYSSVVGADTNLQSALMYAEDGGEIVSEDGETFVPIQTEAKKIGKKLVKEKFIFSDGKIADVNATKPHSEQKKDDVTDIVVEGAYVMPVSTKLNKKDLDSLVSYSTSNYSENGKNFAVEKVTLRDILGEKFEGSFAEATDIITKKYPVMDTEDDLDPIARITNNENIANRSKIIAHLMRLNEAKINKEPIEEVKLTPSMKAKRGGYIQKYVLGSAVSNDPPSKKKPLVNDSPTVLDSLLIYNNALKKEAYYKNNKDYKEKPSETYNNDITSIIKNVKEKEDRYNRSAAIVYKDYDRKAGSLNPKFKYINKNLVQVGDILDGQPDPFYSNTAPEILLSNKILPQGWRGYSNSKLSDASDIPYYDPIAVKPVSLLTANERAERERKYPNSFGEYKINPSMESRKTTKEGKVFYNDIDLFNNKNKPKPPRPDVNIDKLPTIQSDGIDMPSRDLPDLQATHSDYQEGELIRDYPGVPNVKIIQKRRKSDGQMVTVGYENAQGERITGSQTLTRKFQYPKKMKSGGYVQKYVLGSTVSGDPKKPKTALEKRKEKYDQNKPKPVNRYTLKAYEPESKAKQIYKKLVAPVSAMDNRPDTSYEDPSGLDVALGVLNPFAWVDGAATVLKSTKDIVTGEGQGNDYATVGVSAAGAALGLRGSKAKGIGDKISKFMNNMYNPVPSNIIGKKQVVDISDFNKENEYYRVVVGDDAFNDIVQTGTVRTKRPSDFIDNKPGLINLDRRGGTASPSFAKGNVAMEYANNNPNNYIIVSADNSLKPSTMGRHGKGSTMFPTSSEGKHLKELAADKVKVYKHIGDGKYELVDHMPTTPKMLKGGFVSQYVLKPSMSLKKGGYIRKMAAGGGVSDPPGKKYTTKKGEKYINGDDGKTYVYKDGTYSPLKDEKENSAYKSKYEYYKKNVIKNFTPSELEIFIASSKEEGLDNIEQRAFHDAARDKYIELDKINKNNRIVGTKQQQKPVAYEYKETDYTVTKAGNGGERIEDKKTGEVFAKSASGKMFREKDGKFVELNPTETEQISSRYKPKTSIVAPTNTPTQVSVVTEKPITSAPTQSSTQNNTPTQDTQTNVPVVTNKSKTEEDGFTTVPSTIQTPTVTNKAVSTEMPKAPEGKKYTNKGNGATIIEGKDNKYYWKNKDGSYKEAAPQIVDAFKNDMQIKGSSNPTGPVNSWVIENNTNTYNPTPTTMPTITNQRLNVDIQKIPMRNLDPINSMDTMDILGSPIMRLNQIPVITDTQKTSSNNTNIPVITDRKGGDYLVQKAMDWEQATPAYGYADYVKSRTGQSNETMKTGGAKEVGATEPSKYMPKGAYYIPGENKNRYDKDEQGNWYIQKDDGKTWVPASSLPNSSDAIKRLNDESKPWNVSTPSNKTASSSSLVKPRTNVAPNAAPITKKEIENINENNSEIQSSSYRAYSDNSMRKQLLNNFKETSDDDINNTINFLDLAGDTAGDGSLELSAYYAKKIREEKAKRSSYNLKVTSKRKGGYVIPIKMAKGGFVSKYVLKPSMSLKKGGYIRKMAAGGGVSDPPGKKYKSAKGTIIVGDDGKYYFGKQDGSYIEANPQTVDMFSKQLSASKNPSGGENPWLLVEGTKGKPVLSANPKDDEWISQILDFETTTGSRSGTGLKDYGIQKDKWGKKYSYLNKENLSKEDAVRFIREEYISKVKDYPPDVQKRLVDYAYNTGRNIEDVLMHASGLVDTESVQTKNTDYALFDKNKEQIIKNMQDPNFVSKIDQSKHEILKDYWNRKGTPQVYDDTSAKRINMWTPNQRTKVNIGKLPNSYLDPIKSMETMDILGTPVMRSNVQVPISTTNPTIDVKWGGDYLVQKANNWEQATPADGYADYVKSRTGQSNETMKTGGAKEVGTTEPAKYTPKGAYYIPGENKNRYDKDAEGNWYIQKDDGKTWVPASSLPNSADAIKKLNDESKIWNGTQSNKTAASSSLVKPKIINAKPNIIDNKEDETMYDPITGDILKKYKPKKMKKGGYIRKMVAGGPIYPMLPNPNTGIYAIDETGMAPYYELPSMVTNSLYDISPINPQNPLVPSVTNATPNTGDVKNLVTTSSTPNTGDTEVLDMYRTKISERKGDAVRDAEESRRGYKDLSRRVGMRDLMQLGTGLAGIGLQDRTERRAFKRPLYIDQKYRGLSPQQINQQAEASTGAGVEAIKQMMNGGGDRVTARLAPVLIDRLMSQQGQTRKAYVDQNTSLERAKYAERGTIQQFNIDEEARARNEERDFNNKAISSSAQLINKYISSRSAGDIEGYKTEEGINRDLTDKLYKIDNNELQTDMIDKEYEMQMSDVRQKIAEMEAELMNPNITFDEAARKSKEWYIARGKEDLKNLEERQKKSKIRQNINGN